MSHAHTGRIFGIRKILDKSDKGIRKIRDISDRASEKSWINLTKKIPSLSRLKAVFSGSLERRKKVLQCVKSCDRIAT